MGMRSKIIMKTAVFLAVALVIGVIENALPPVLPPLPYARLGLSNIAVLLAVFFVGVPHAYLITVLKCLFIAAVQGNFSAVLYSVPAGILSLTVMVLLIKCKAFSVPAVSVFGAITHNAAQVASASIITASPAVWALFPYLAAFGAAAGLVTGVLSYLLIKKLP